MLEISYITQKVSKLKFDDVSRVFLHVQNSYGPQKKIQTIFFIIKCAPNILKFKSILILTIEKRVKIDEIRSKKHLSKFSSNQHCEPYVQSTRLKLGVLVQVLVTHIQFRTILLEPTQRVNYGLIFCQIWNCMEKRS